MATSSCKCLRRFPSARPPVDTQVESLQKLQKAAQKISSILDLDQLIDNIVNDVAHSFGCWRPRLSARRRSRRNGDGRRPRLHRHTQGFSSEDRQGRHGRLCCLHRPDALRARTCARTSITSAANNPLIQKWRFPFMSASAWSECSPRLILIWTPFPASNSEFFRPCAITLPSPSTTRTVSNRSAPSVKP